MLSNFLEAELRGKRVVHIKVVGSESFIIWLTIFLSHVY